MVIAVAACFLDLGRDFGSYEQSAKMCFAMQASFVVKVLVAAVKYFQEHFLGVGALLAYPIVSHFGFVGHCVLRMCCHHTPPRTHATVPNQPAQEVRTGACLYVHPVTQHRIVLFCDDFLCRGNREVSERFYVALAERFECKDPDWLSVDSTLTFTGMDISEVAEAGGTVSSAVCLVCLVPFSTAWLACLVLCSVVCLVWFGIV